MKAKHILFPLGYACLNAIVALPLIPFVFVPFYLQRFPVNMLTITVWSVYFCAPATVAGGAVFGLIMSLIRPPPTWRIHVAIFLGLIVLEATVLAVFFPHE